MAIPLLLLRDLEVLRRRLTRRRPELARWAAGFILALLAYLGTGVFLHLAFERYYWFMIALAAAAAGILQRVHEQADPVPHAPFGDRHVDSPPNAEWSGDVIGILPAAPRPIRADPSHPSSQWRFIS